MSRPVLIDCFCGAGGATRGYQLAGFHVVGIDIVDQPHYVGDEFVRADALEWLADPHWEPGYDAIHASPPCQRWMTVPGAHGDEYPDLLTPTLDMLRQLDVPWVVENVPEAPMDGFILCGSTFGLPIVRHRRFATNWSPGLLPSMCPQGRWKHTIDHGSHIVPYAHTRPGEAWRPRWRTEVMPVVWPWMTLEESSQAIPPAYTEWIGNRLLELL